MLDKKELYYDGVWLNVVISQMVLWLRDGTHQLKVVGSNASTV